MNQGPPPPQSQQVTQTLSGVAGVQSQGSTGGNPSASITIVSQKLQNGMRQRNNNLSFQIDSNSRSHFSSNQQHPNSNYQQYNEEFQIQTKNLNRTFQEQDLFEYNSNVSILNPNFSGQSFMVPGSTMSNGSHKYFVETITQELTIR